MTTKKISTRFISQDDTSSWIEMWHEYMKFYNHTVSSDVITNTLNLFFSNNDSCNCLVAYNEKNDLVGFLTYVKHVSTWKLKPVCYLNDLFVIEQHRKQGVANTLLEKLKTIAVEQDVSQIYWLTKPDNHVARAFYDKIAKSESWARYSIQLD